MLKTNLMLVSNCLGQVVFIVSDEVFEVLVPGWSLLSSAGTLKFCCGHSGHSTCVCSGLDHSSLGLKGRFKKFKSGVIKMTFLDSTKEYSTSKPFQNVSVELLPVT